MSDYTVAPKTIMMHDSSTGGSPEDVAAMVASGDCFITLATTLEAIAQSLTVDAKKAGPQLEWLSSTLFYMQRHYKIESKETLDHYLK
jgi:hypothetical protein